MTDDVDDDDEDDKDDDDEDDEGRKGGGRTLMMFVLIISIISIEFLTSNKFDVWNAMVNFFICGLLIWVLNFFANILVAFLSGNIYD